MINRSILIGAALLAIARPCPGLEIMLAGIVTESRVAPHIVGDPAEMRVTIISSEAYSFAEGYTRLSIEMSIDARTLGTNGTIVWTSHNPNWYAWLKIYDIDVMESSLAGIVGDAISFHPRGGFLEAQEYDPLGNPIGVLYPGNLLFLVEAIDWFDGCDLEQIPSYLDLPPAMFLTGDMNQIFGYSAATIRPISIRFLHDEIPGDANRDGIFDRFDIVQVQQAGKYQRNIRTTWAEGDWNADGYFDNRDLMAALAWPSPVAVPESSGLCLAIFAALFCLSGQLWFDRRRPGNA